MLLNPEKIIEKVKKILCEGETNKRKPKWSKWPDTLSENRKEILRQKGKKRWKNNWKNLMQKENIFVVANANAKQKKKKQNISNLRWNLIKMFIVKFLQCK